MRSLFPHTFQRSYPASTATGTEIKPTNTTNTSGVHHGGEGVVGRLTVVDVVVGVDRLPGADRAAGELDGAVGDDLVGVHVGLRATAGLEHHQRELPVELAVDHLLRRSDDQI